MRIQRLSNLMLAYPETNAIVTTTCRVNKYNIHNQLVEWKQISQSTENTLNPAESIYSLHSRLRIYCM
jgi:hypothetical protein